jgi:hypothetical protein
VQGRPAALMRNAAPSQVAPLPQRMPSRRSGWREFLARWR